MTLHDPVAPMLVLATNPHFRDPALVDLSDAELEAYRVARDLDAIRGRLRGEPTTFVVQRLPAPLSAMLDAMTGTARTMTALAVACHEVRLPDGAVLAPDPRRMQSGANGTRIADDDWLGELRDRFGMRTVREIGSVAADWAALPRAARGPFSY